MNALPALDLRQRRLWCALALLLVLAVQSIGVQAAELRWRGRPFQLVANDKPLPDLLRDLAASQGITAVIDSKISGTISGRFSGNPKTILDSLCSTYGLTWYYDGAFLYIDPAADAVSEMLPITRGTGSRVAETVRRLHIYDARYPLVINDDAGSVFVSGPKRYVEMVRQAVRAADQRFALADKAQVRVFPLKYVWASDVSVNRNGREAVVPGVVSVLRNLYGSRTAGGRGGSRSPTAPFRLGPARELKLSSGETLSAPKVEIAGGRAATEGTDNATAGTFSGDDLPQFAADPTTNAVLVRDVPERIAQYEPIIASLDARPRLIEIEVTIMDISNDTLAALGVDWRAHGRHADFQVGRGDAPPLTWNNATTEAGQTGETTPLGGVFTASIGNELRNYLLARVHALSKSGDANFVARPKVLTLNKTEAVLENLSEVHVRVNGFQDAGLFNITAGTSVRVTPLILDEADGRGVMMSIDIQDGELAQATVDNIPIVRRRNIDTQAMVRENTSLLIAGFSSEQNVNGVTGVPLLKDIPVVGRLFQYDEKTRSKMERFYLLTPRLVIPTAQVPPPSPTLNLPMPLTPPQREPVGRNESFVEPGRPPHGG
jgi:type III secretion protein C